MAKRTFAIGTPYELRRLMDFLKEELDMSGIIDVWNASKQKGEKTRLDSAFFAEFSGDRKQIGIVYYIKSDGKRVDIGRLRYLTAMHWCEGRLHLKDR